MFVVQITKLKIDTNPFAKGFRDSSRLSDQDGFAAVELITTTTQFDAINYLGLSCCKITLAYTCI